MSVIGQIVQGHVNEVLGLNQDIAKVRMEICRKCPLFKDTMGGICNPKLWLNPKTGDVSTTKKHNYFRGCGCRLAAKITVPRAKCPTGKW